MADTIKVKKSVVKSPFWVRYRSLIADEAINYQWKIMNNENNTDEAERSYALRNFRIAANLEKGHHYGMVFQDTDVYKWLETVAYILKYEKNEDLKKRADKVVKLIGKAQESDGYLSTYYQIEKPDLKFKQLQQSHELYCMGHYIEAGVAYYKSTKNKQALDIAEKMAVFIYNYFLSINHSYQYDGHPEIEQALVKLYSCTKKDKYLNLARHFVSIRGKNTNFFEKQNKENNIEDDPFPEMRRANKNYFFDSVPLKYQKLNGAHAVRALYFLSGAAGVARLKNDKILESEVLKLWNEIIHKQMFITGNVGQTSNGEAFTQDYDLPNLTNYGETCASVAMILLARELEENNYRAEFGEILEKELYNGALSGIGLNGKNYFYSNPMETKDNHLKKGFSRERRQKWFSCACCPTNITRLIASLDKYIYVVKDRTIILDQLIANETEFSHDIHINVLSSLPWGNRVKIRILNPQQIKLHFKVRLPEWSDSNEINVIGNDSLSNIENNILDVSFAQDLKIEINLDNQIHFVKANPKVRNDVGKVAIQKGPLIYCQERADNIGEYENYIIPKNCEVKTYFRNDELNGVEKIDILNAKYQQWTSLYSYNSIKTNKKVLTLIPYYAWANRMPRSMTVWMESE